VLEGQREAILHFLRARFDLSMAAADEVGKRLRAIENPALLRSLAEEAARAETLQAFLAALDGDKVAA